MTSTSVLQLFLRRTRAGTLALVALGFSLLQAIQVLFYQLPPKTAIVNGLAEIFTGWILTEFIIWRAGGSFSHLVEQLHNSRRYIRQQQALSQVVEALARAIEDNEIYHTLAQGLHQAMGYPYVRLYQRNRNTNTWQLRESKGYLPGAVESHLRQQVHQLNEVQTALALPPVPRLDDTFDIPTGVLLPILVEDTTDAILWVGSNKDTDLTDDLPLLNTATLQTAIALARAHLLHTERYRARQLLALRDTMTEILAEPELMPLLKAVLHRAIALLNATGGDMGLFNPTTQEIEIAFSYNMGRDYAGTRMKLGEGAMGRAAQQRSVINIADYANWEGRSPQYTSGIWHGVSAAPLIVGETLVGAIGVVRNKPNQPFSDEDINLLMLFAQQAALAIQNARLYQTALRASEQQRAIYQVSQEIVSSLDPERAYIAIHQATARLMPAEAFAICLLNKEENCIEAVYLTDHHGRVPVKRIGIGEGLSGKVIASGKPIRIGDVPNINNEYPGIQPIHFGEPHSVRSVLAVPMRLGDEVRGMLSAQSYQSYAYTDEDEQTLITLANQAMIAIENARLFAHTEQMAMIDELTQIYNRRHLFELAALELERANRYQYTLAVLMFDIDHFKRVNDTYGHLVGDTVLKTVAWTCHQILRSTDTLGRYGGEEFVVLLPETDLKAALVVAERLRLQVERTRVNTPNGSISVTISIGVTTLRKGGEPLLNLFNRVDQVLYRAKQNGRNCFESEPPPQATEP